MNVIGVSSSHHHGYLWQFWGICVPVIMVWYCSTVSGHLLQVVLLVVCCNQMWSTLQPFPHLSRCSLIFAFSMWLCQVDSWSSFQLCSFTFMFLHLLCLEIFLFLLTCAILLSFKPSDPMSALYGSHLHKAPATSVEYSYCIFLKDISGNFCHTVWSLLLCLSPQSLLIRV